MKLTAFNRTLLYTSYYIVWFYSFTYLAIELIFIKENSSMSSNKHYEPYRQTPWSINRENQGRQLDRVSILWEKVESAFLFSLFKPLSQSPANTRVKFPLLPWITLLEVCSRHTAVIIWTVTVGVLQTPCYRMAWSKKGVSAGFQVL